MAENAQSDRVAAVKALATSKDPLAIETCIRSLGTLDADLTRAAVDSLRALGATSVLCKRLENSSTIEAKKVQALVALRHLKEADAVPALTTALKDQSALVRREAALALLVTGPKPAEDALIAALDDGDGDVRYGAADALGEVGSQKAKQALERRGAKENNPTVKFAIDGALRKLA